MEALVNEDTEKVARKFWAYFVKYAENLAKKGNCFEHSYLKKTSTRSGAWRR